MAALKKRLEQPAKSTELFNDALTQMSRLSTDYRDGLIKAHDYNQKLDAVVNASGWNKREFYEEIERRKATFGI